MTRSEYERFQSGNQKVLNKYSKMSKPVVTETQQKSVNAAVDQKNMLLEFDRTSAQRTKVIDDQSDYFCAENPWLSAEEKNVIEMRRKKYIESKSRLNRKFMVTFDFAGKKGFKKYKINDIRRLISNSSDKF